MAEPDGNSGDFLSEILKPGSSLQPRFLLALDLAFVALLFILVALAFLTAGNLHIFALIAIELALWASVKWYRMFPATLIHSDDTTGSSMN
jgi:hypothetical protein